MKVFLIILSLINFSFESIWEVKNSDKEEADYGKLIPIMLGIHNEHLENDSLKIEFIDNSKKSIIIHEGALNEWGMKWIDCKIKTGPYILKLSWKEESGHKHTQQKVFIKPETKFFSLNIELANDLQRGREHNAIYLDQYTSSLENVEFKRNWNPNQQFKKKKLLLPNYNVTNNNDSTIYGAYMRFSSQLSINWVQLHDIAFMKFEQKVDSNWVNISCNAPRIVMNLKTSEEGKTLTDMKLGCASKNFKVGIWYRIRIDYMINDRFYEKSPAQEGIEDIIYVEQSIYSFTDEFKLEK